MPTQTDIPPSGYLAGSRRRKVLVVDDDPGVRRLLVEYLALQGFEVVDAAGGSEALAALGLGQFDVVVSDVQMPGMNGLALLDEICRAHPDVAVLMLTGCEDVALAVRAMKRGALDYVLKPFSLDGIESAVRHAIERHDAVEAERARVCQLEDTVREQTAQLRVVLGEASQASSGTLDALVAALDAREHETSAHSWRVAEYTVLLAERLGLGGAELEEIRRGALLHDIGKIGIPDRILLKPGPLTPEERVEMQRHPRIGYWILNGVEKFRAAAGMVLAHHEQFDGNGYPNGLAGDSIPLGARIFAVADTLDAITSARPYRSGLSFAAAREEIALEAGMQFDPAVVEAYLSVPRTVWHEIWDRSVARTQRPLAELPLVVL